MRSFRIAVGIGLAAAVGACLFPSFDDLEGQAGADGGDVGDGSFADGRGPADGSHDAKTDAPSDGGQGSDAPATDGSGYVEPCDAGAFCDDFDDPKSTLIGNWTTVQKSPGSSLARQPAGLSAPNALVAVISANDASAGMQLNAMLQKTLALPDGGDVNGFHISYDFAVDQFDVMYGPTNVVLAQADIKVGTSALNLRLRIFSGPQLRFEAAVKIDGGAGKPYDFGAVSISSSSDASAWHHAELDVDLTASPATAAFTLDAMSLTDGGAVAIPTATFGPGPLEFEAPGFVGTPTTGWGFRFDNVVITPR